MVLAGGALAYFAARIVRVGRQSRRHGRWVSIDAGERAPPVLRSDRLGLVGRPDAVHRLADGRSVPVEWKSRPTPSHGPPRSHEVQALAYALLLDETTGHPPPYAVLHYGDGREFRIDWTRARRAELLDLLSQVRVPYRGAARPSVARCRHCPWNAVCDARAVG